MGVEVDRYIVIDSEICHGKPTFKGTRVLVSDVIELVASGVPVKEILRDYYPSLSEEMVQDALGWAANIIRGEHHIKYSKIPV